MSHEIKTPPCPECDQGRKRPQEACALCKGCGYPFEAIPDPRVAAILEAGKVLNTRGTVKIQGWLREFGLVPMDDQIERMPAFYLTRTDQWYRASEMFDPAVVLPPGMQARQPLRPPTSKMRLWLHERWENGSWNGGIIGEINPDGERWIQVRLQAAREHVLKTTDPYRPPTEIFEFIEL